MYNLGHMNIINSTTLRNNLATSFAAINEKRDYLLVANKGKITSAIVDIDLFEDLIELADAKYKDTIKEAREEYENGDAFTHNQVFGEL